MLRGLLADPAPAGRVRYITIPLQYGRGSGYTVAEYPAADLDQHVGPRRLSEFGNRHARYGSGQTTTLHARRFALLGKVRRTRDGNDLTHNSPVPEPSNAVKLSRSEDCLLLSLSASGLVNLLP